mmetsp:Transcript_8994/g.10418  ORF Transcript_8994/g.10418 Transcript_8994/m.10418 type:complete len:169 (-) Transcript_8994:133-639(-)
MNFSFLFSFLFQTKEKVEEGNKHSHCTEDSDHSSTVCSDSCIGRNDVNNVNSTSTKGHVSTRLSSPAVTMDKIIHVPLHHNHDKFVEDDANEQEIIRARYDAATWNMYRRISDYRISAARRGHNLCGANTPNVVAPDNPVLSVQTQQERRSILASSYADSPIVFDMDL